MSDMSTSSDGSPLGISINLTDVTLNTVHTVIANMYERLAANDWRQMTPDQMLTTLSGVYTTADYQDAYAHLGLGGNVELGGEAVRYVTYAVMSGFAVDTVSVTAVDGAPVAKSSNTESLSLAQAYGIGSGYWAPGRLDDLFGHLLTTALTKSTRLRRR